MFLGQIWIVLSETNRRLKLQANHEKNKKKNEKQQRGLCEDCVRSSTMTALLQHMLVRRIWRIFCP